MGMGIESVCPMARLLFSLLLFVATSQAGSPLPLSNRKCSSTLADFSDATRKVVESFLEISRIPRASGNEKKIRDFLIQSARRTNHNFEVDRAGNLIIEVPPTPEFANVSSAIALQSHLDMVLSVPGARLNKDLVKAFEKGVPNIVYEDDFVHTQGVSSLGADNGIGVATMLRYLYDKETPHPRLYLLFTTEEETTFKGATALRIPKEVKSLINLDMEALDQVTIGCQGACRWIAEYEGDVQHVPKNSHIVHFDVDGFLGGHSGLDIHKNRGNVARLAAEFLLHTSRRLPSLQLIQFYSGNDTIFNKIPNSAHMEFAVSATDFPTLKALVKRQVMAWQRDYSSETNKPKGTLKFADSKSANWAINREQLHKILRIFLLLRDGPILKGEGLPNDWNLTSNQAYFMLSSNKNLAKARYGVMARAYDSESLQVFVQSSIVQARAYSNKKLVRIVHEFPPWTPDPNSPLIPLVTETMKANGVEVSFVGAVAGGLETASLAHRYPEIPMVSIGPNIFDVHSPAERFSVSSVQKFLSILDNVLMVLGKALSD